VEVAKEQSSENPVYYVQYAHARINSIFREAEVRGFRGAEAEGLETVDIGPLVEQEETGLIKKLCQYPSVFEGAVLAREPHRITYYLQELASLFHGFYRKHRVLLEDDRQLALARLALVRGVEFVLHEGLTILGVEAPEKM